MRAHLSHNLHWDPRLEADRDVDQNAAIQDIPGFDNRDADTTWIWLGPNLHLEVDREFADRLLASFIENLPEGQN